MKHLMFVTLLLSSTAFAGTGSLWCAHSSYGTPTETFESAALPYSLVQIDKMSETQIQVDIEDLYYGNSKIFKASLAGRPGNTISDIALGKYVSEKEMVLEVVKGKILLKDGFVTYKCEIPGDYQKDYSSYVR